MTKDWRRATMPSIAAPVVQVQSVLLGAWGRTVSPCSLLTLLKWCGPNRETGQLCRPGIQNFGSGRDVGGP